MCLTLDDLRFYLSGGRERKKKRREGRTSQSRCHRENHTFKIMLKCIVLYALAGKESLYECS